MEIAKRLKELHEQMYAGQYTEVLFRVCSWSNYIVELEGYHTDVYAAVSKWMDKCEELSCDFFDSIIEMYNTGGYLGTEKMEIFTRYNSSFQTAVEYLLGDIQWSPPEFVRERSSQAALCYTKVHLKHLLEKTPNE